MITSNFKAKFSPMKDLPTLAHYKAGDVLVIFGEVFARGYINGLIDAAEKMGMKVIYSTVGRRDENKQLRKLNEDELTEKIKENQQPLINIPLEAGFDMSPSDNGTSPCDQLSGLKLSQWNEAKINWNQIEESYLAGTKDFRKRLRQYTDELEKLIPAQANIVFAHTMAGGIPRAKIVLPVINKVFKGFEKRYMSSLDMWESEIGKLCDKSFDAVTAETLDHLIDLTEKFRIRAKNENKTVSYVAYGYHGTELLINNEYTWQSYSPYLQGFAKMKLEEISNKWWDKAVRTTVFNVPEILTNSSSVFLGVEVALYPLMGALKQMAPKHKLSFDLEKQCASLLNEGCRVESVLDFTSEYFSSDLIKNKWSDFSAWPQHNGLQQMNLMRNTSNGILKMHKDPKNLLTAYLSKLVFKACGTIMLHESANPSKPYTWVGHNMVAMGLTEI